MLCGHGQGGGQVEIKAAHLQGYTLEVDWKLREVSVSTGQVKDQLLVTINDDAKLTFEMQVMTWTGWNEEEVRAMMA